MKKISLLMVLVFFAFCANAQLTEGQLPRDPDTKVGKLSNGLTYYIRHNGKPENQACFYIAQQVGSMQEEDNQRGLAHFLEHMAFNGTENFPGKRIIDMLQENGVDFGSELNAYTSFDETVYNIDKVPTNKKSWLLDSCLMILSDWSHRLTLDDKEIDNERGVIHSEWRMRTGASYRMLERSLPTLYPNSKYAYRMPIGIMDIVDNFPYQALKDYYKTWYYPHHQGIIVVGDIDVNEMEQKIIKYFSVFETPKDAPKRQYYTVPDNEQPIFVAEKDKEQTYNIVALMFKTEPWDRDKKDNELYLISDIINDLISDMTEQRFNELLQKPDAPFVYASAGVEEYLVSKTKNAFSFQIVAKEGSEIESLKSIMREALRIKKFGFSQTELDRAKESYLNSLERLYNNRNKQENSYFVQECLDNFLDNEPLMSIEQTYQKVKEIMPLLSLEAVNKTVNSMISEDGKNMVCLAMQQEKDSAEYVTVEEMQTAVNQVKTESIEAYVDNVKVEPLLSKKLKSGKVKSEIIPSNGFDTKVWTLSNGAKIVFKKTDFKNDEIVFNAVRFGGTSLYDINESNFANISLCVSLVNSLGLGAFSFNELSKTLAVKQCNVSPYISNTLEGFSGNSTKKDLQTMFEMLYLYFTDVNTNQDDYLSFMNQQKIALKNRDANPMTAFSDSLTNALYDNNFRTKPMVLSDLDKADKNAMMEIYAKLFSDPASFTYFFIGDIDEELLKTLVTKYIGSFKKAVLKSPSYISGRQKYHEGQKDVVFKRKMETPQSLVYDYLYSEVDYTVKNYAISKIAAEVLGEMFFNEIREEKSIAYSASARSSFVHSEKEGKAKDIMIFNSPVKPEHALEAQDVMYNILKTVSEDGFDVALMEKAQEYFVKHYQETLKSNSYWLGVIQDYEIYSTDTHTDFVNAIKSVKPEDIKDYCKRIYQNYNKVNVIMLPEEN